VSGLCNDDTWIRGGQYSTRHELYVVVAIDFAPAEPSAHGTSGLSQLSALYVKRGRLAGQFAGSSRCMEAEHETPRSMTGDRRRTFDEPYSRTSNDSFDTNDSKERRAEYSSNSLFGLERTERRTGRPGEGHLDLSLASALLK
jgi:hypothetical protein